VSRSIIFFMASILLTACAKDPPLLELGDPLRAKQWYLSGDPSDATIVSINLGDTKYTGVGVTVAIVDNGVDVYHPDLIDRFLTGEQIDYTGNTAHFQNADHGTSVAGIIAATRNNGIGVTGIAPEVDLIARNALKASSTQNLADALSENVENISIIHNSWGDFNSWGNPFALRSPVGNAFIKGASVGRGGKGTIYVFAAGNGDLQIGGVPTDNVNLSGYVNNRFTIPVCAVDAYGAKASYSETGATLVVCGPSTGVDGYGIVTTDIQGDKGYNSDVFKDDLPDHNYTENFGGTSAAAPMVTGVVALMLEANPNLGWRDIRRLLAQSAFKNDAKDLDWKRNGAGFWVNHKYGFGLVDAARVVDLAKVAKVAGPLSTSTFAFEKTVDIPDNDLTGVSIPLDIEDDLTIEFVDLWVSIPKHERIGDLEIVLTSPSGTESVLAERHYALTDVFRYTNWRFGSMRHLAEHSKGTWTLTLRDVVAGYSAPIEKATIAIYGTR
jgi:subtilisin family serine protease